MLPDGSKRCGISLKIALLLLILLLGLLLRLEEINDGGVDYEKDTSSWAETENLGDETLVKSSETFLLCNKGDRWESPVVLGDDAWDTDSVLDSRLDDIGSVLFHVRVPVLVAVSSRGGLVGAGE